MIKLGKITEYLEENLSARRFKHSINVASEAEKLANKYGADVVKAKIAGLVHDCAREKKRERMIEYVLEEGLQLDAVTTEVKELLHGAAAIHICKKQFEIFDEEILSAVMYHTTGRADMSLLDKVVFLADYIEPAREFPEIEELKKLSYTDIDNAMLFAYDTTIKYVISKKGLIHPNSIIGRNDILIKLENRSQNTTEGIGGMKK